MTTMHSKSCEGYYPIINMVVQKKKSWLECYEFWHLYRLTTNIHPPQVTRAISCEKSAFLTFLSIVTAVAHIIMRMSCLIAKPDFTYMSCQVHNSSLEFQHTNNTRKKQKQTKNKNYHHQQRPTISFYCQLFFSGHLYCYVNVLQ